MTEYNPNSTYPMLKYTRGFVAVRVTNVSHYRQIVNIHERNEADLMCVVQVYAPKWV